MFIACPSSEHGKKGIVLVPRLRPISIRTGRVPVCIRFYFSAYREETGNERGGSLLVMPGNGLFIGKSARFEGVADIETKRAIFSWWKQDLSPDLSTE